MWAAYTPDELKDHPEIQDPHRLVQCASHPDRMWVQHHNGVFVSNYEGNTWREVHDVPPTSFGFTTAVHPAEPDTAWFIQAVKDEERIPKDGALTVTRTRDGGQSFEVITEGLPQQHAYDIVFRHALDVDSTGNCLAFGSTTGSLFASNDGGTSWQQTEGHLPPVYCVRFR